METILAIGDGMQKDSGCCPWNQDGKVTGSELSPVNAYTHESSLSASNIISLSLGSGGLTFSATPGEH
jgi:hypothetical protein